MFDIATLRAGVSGMVRNAILTIFSRGLRLSPESRFQDMGSLRFYLNAVAYGADAAAIQAIRFIEGPLKEHRFELQKVTCIGRDPGDGIQFDSNSPYSSRFHCMLTPYQGITLIADTHSTYETFLNGRKLEPDGPEKLHTGDIIRIGSKQQLFIYKTFDAALIKKDTH